MTTCATCGVELYTGSWPWCPHGVSQVAAHGDDIIGGFVQENFGPEPETFYSKKAMLKRADELGLQPFVRYSGPHDTPVTNWAAGATEKQLRDAAELLSRGSRTTKAVGVPCETLETSVRELNFGVRANVYAD